MFGRCKIVADLLEHDESKRPALKVFNERGPVGPAATRELIICRVTTERALARVAYYATAFGRHAGVFIGPTHRVRPNPLALSTLRHRINA